MRRIVNDRIKAAGCVFLAGFMLMTGLCASAGAAEFDALLQQAEQGGAESQFDVGTAYLTGTGVNQDATEAVRWFTRSARAGHVPAQYALGEVYAAGRGVPSDRVEAYFWFNIAARNGSEIAATRRDAIGSRLTSSEFFGIQARIREWTNRGAAQPRPGRASPGSARPVRTSSAFLVSAAGVALTSAHSVNGCGAITVQGAATGGANILATDADLDLALLQIDGSVAGTARLRAGAMPRLGSEVVVFGYPLQGVLAYGANVTDGIISGLAGPGNDGRVIQHTAPVQPGNSGAPLLDRQGNVIGVVVSKINAWQTARRVGDIPQAINFAVRLRHVRAFLDANGISAAAGGDRPRQSIADIAERSARFTLLLECWG